MHDSVLKSAIRSFFMTFFAILGIFVAFLVIILFFSTASETIKEPERSYRTEILPNAKGVRKILSNTAPVILKLNVNGVIGNELLNSQTIRQQLIESREGDLKNNRVKAILLSINSPGGTVIDSDNIYRYIKAYKDQYKVPVHAFIDGICASGSYYTAVAADKIHATNASLIGSVGVVTGPFFNAVGLLEKIGVDPLMIYAGKGKTDLSPFRKWEPNEQKNMQDIVNHYYNSFLNIVTSERPDLSKEKLMKDFGAEVFPAQDAAKMGYIDGAGYNYASALNELLKQIGIDDDFYQVVQLQSKKWYAEVFNSKNPLLKGIVKHQVDIVGEIDPALRDQFLYLYRPNM
jgi:protease IV